MFMLPGNQCVVITTCEPQHEYNFLESTAMNNVVLNSRLVQASPWILLLYSYFMGQN